MIDVLVLGQPFQASRVVALLNHGSDDLHARVVPPRDYADLLVRRTPADRLVVMRVGYRVGAPTRRGRLFDAYWDVLRRRHRSAVLSHYWLGSDVMRTVADSRTGAIRRGRVAAAQGDLHLSVAPWLTDELASIGLTATTALLPPPQTPPGPPPALPEQFTALCYLPSHRFDFFRGQLLLGAAQQLKGVGFDIVGNRGPVVHQGPDNVRWHGWVADMSHRYAAATVIVRVPVHDGFGNSVIEGLMFGRHVIYTYDVPFVRKLDPVSVDGLVAALAELRDRHDAGTLDLNEEGRAYALREFDADRLAERLRAIVRAAAA